MTVEEAIKSLTYGVEYQLIGAKTGRKIAKSWTNKKEYIEKYHEYACPGMYPSFRQGYSESIHPIMCIWVTGE